ncbi:recombinase [Peptoclostridium acidaminophilum DSM 3953]|uniref:Recombinase n=1 Tax=Peptoclostridium acidaminophilum DSM 3953 TaxID=1286171 RepID=W8TI34_PEPAC|nr:recombinase [Peptoclostridium acidaminophilum]AHM55852.1 recombinase [Peptoclostridium acidaminophilum DSM 3953]
MGHIPYGYVIVNGKAVIQEDDAKKVRELFKAYLSGLSLTDSAKKAGINRYHGSISKMLTDKRYVFDPYYPVIIEKEWYEKVQIEKRNRAEKLGRIKERTDEKPTFLKQRFAMPMPKALYDDPFRQAEYAYSLIESEVLSDGKQECNSYSGKKTSW